MVEAKEPPFDNPKVTSGWRCDEGGSEQFFAFTTKYSQQIADQTQPRTDANYPFLRYADIVLIFAEAANELNGPTKESVDALMMFAPVVMQQAKNWQTLQIKPACVLQSLKNVQWN